MHSINTRRWPRYHVRLPVFIVPKTGPEKVVVPGMVSELSRAGMELYGGLDLHPGDVMEVEFQTPGGVRIAGVVRNRSGFCFGLEFHGAAPELDPAPDELESLIVQRHEAYLRQVQRKIDQSLQMALEIRKFREEIEILAQEDLPDQ